MKIRLQSDSIRFRLDRQEVDSLARGESIREITRFSIMDELEFTLQPWLLNVTEAKLDNHRIIVSVPRQQLTEWAVSAGEGISALVDNNNSGLRILVEKDFECIGRENEKAGLFPNPKSEC